MKRTVCLLLALLMVTLVACGTVDVPPTTLPEPSSVPTSAPTAEPTQSPTPAPSAEPTTEPTPAPSADPTPEPSEEQPVVYYHPLTGLPTDTDLTGTKPVAVMINNLKQALPQQGVSQADIIYEVLAEGGITRMLAVYQDPIDVGPIGSVRSARLYYFELALGHDAVFVHAGGSPNFYTARDNKGVATVDGVKGYYSGSGAGIFWRDRTRIEGHTYAYEHSLLTSGHRLSTILKQNGLIKDHRAGFVNGMNFSENGEPLLADGSSAKLVIVPFSNYKVGMFRYQEDSNLYTVEEFGAPYIDGNDGSQVAITNVLVLQAETEVIDSEGRLDIDLSSGKGWYACGGKVIPISWVKDKDDSPLRFLNSDGQDILLTPGKSYVCIIPTTRDIAFE